MPNKVIVNVHSQAPVLPPIIERRTVHDLTRARLEESPSNATNTEPVKRRHEESNEPEYITESEMIGGYECKSKVRIVIPRYMKNLEEKVVQALAEKDALQEKLQELSIELIDWKEEMALVDISSVGAAAQPKMLLDASNKDKAEAQHHLESRLEQAEQRATTQREYNKRLLILLKEGMNGTLDGIADEVEPEASEREGAKTDIENEPLRITEGVTNLIHKISALINEREDMLKERHTHTKESEQMQHERSQINQALQDAQIDICNIEAEVKVIAQERDCLIAENKNLQEVSRKAQAEGAQLIKDHAASLTGRQDATYEALAEALSKHQIIVKDMEEKHASLISIKDREILDSSENSQRDQHELISAHAKEVQLLKDSLDNLKEKHDLMERQNEASKIRLAETRSALQEAETDFVSRQNDITAKHSSTTKGQENTISELKSDILRLETQIGIIKVQKQDLEKESKRAQLQAQADHSALIKEHVNKVKASAEEHKKMQERHSLLEMQHSITLGIVQQHQEDMDKLEGDLKMAKHLSSETVTGLQIKLEQQTKTSNEITAKLEARCRELQEAFDIREKDLSHAEKLKEDMRIGNSNDTVAQECLTDSLDASAIEPYMMTPNAKGKRKEGSQSTLMMALSGSASRKRSQFPAQGTKSLTPSQINAFGLPSTPYNSRQIPPNSRDAPNGLMRPTLHALTSPDSANAPKRSYNNNSDPFYDKPLPAPGFVIKESSAAMNGRFISPQLRLSVSRESTPSPSYMRSESVERGGRNATPGPSNFRRGQTPSSPRGSPSPSISVRMSSHGQSTGASHGTGLFNNNEIAQKLVEGMNEMARAVTGLRDEVLNKHTTSPKSRYNPTPFRKPTVRKPRDKYHTDLMGRIRKTMNPALGIKKDTEIVQAVNDGHFISEADVDQLDYTDLDSETMRNNANFLKPYWDNLKSEYNAALARIFVDQFLIQYPEHHNDEDDILQHFGQRLASLKTILSRHIPRDNENEEDVNLRNQRQRDKELRQRRIRQRQWEGYYRRTNDLAVLVESNPSLKSTFNTIQQLGVNGYSSDETCDEGYLVKVLPWRNKKLNKVVQIAIEAHPTVNINGNNLAGGQMRSRIYRPYAPISTTAAPEGLPSNFYDDRWYSELSHTNQMLLKVGPPVSYPGDDSDMDES